MLRRCLCRSRLFLGKSWDELPVVADSDVPKTAEDMQDILNVFKMWGIKYGSIYKAPLIISPKHALHVSTAELIEEVFQKQGKDPVLSPEVPNPAKAWLSRTEPYKSANAEFIITVNGAEWRRQRLPLQRHLLSPNAVQIVSPAIERVAADLIQWIEARVNPQTREIPEGLTTADMTFYYAFEAVNTAIYGCRLGMLEATPPPRAVQFQRDVRNLFNEGLAAAFESGWAEEGGTSPSYEKMGKTLESLLGITNEVIHEMKPYVTSGKCPLGLDDFVLKDLMSDGNITEVDLTLMCSVLMLAGTDTTSNSMQWMFSHLVADKALQQRIQTQIRDVVGTRQITYDDLPKLPLVKAIVQESWRVTPTVGANIRIIKDAVEIGGYDIPAGTVVILNKAAASTKAPFNTDKFNVDHWLDFDRATQTKALLASSNFGNGPRMCPGSRVATLELQLGIANLLQNYTLEKGEGYVVPKPSVGTIAAPNPPPAVKFIKNN